MGNEQTKQGWFSYSCIFKGRNRKYLMGHWNIMLVCLTCSVNRKTNKLIAVCKVLLNKVFEVGRGKQTTSKDVILVSCVEILGTFIHNNPIWDTSHSITRLKSISSEKQTKSWGKKCNQVNNLWQVEIKWVAYQGQLKLILALGRIISKCRELLMPTL